MRKWERSTFCRVYVGVLSRFNINTTLEATILGKILDAAGPDGPVVSLHGGPHVLAEAFARYLGSGYRVKIVAYPTFNLQRTGASVFENLDRFSMREFVVNRLKSAEAWDWMGSCPALRKSVFTNDLSMPGLLDLVANIVGVCPLVLSYLKETGHKDDADSVPLWAFYLRHLNVVITALLFRTRGWTGNCTTVSLLAWNSGCVIFFWKFVSVIITFSVWFMLVRSGCGSVPWELLGTH